MSVYELRDVDEARRWIVQGLWLARAAPVAPEMAAQSLAWSLEIAAAGLPLPPAGFVADVGHAALRAGNEEKPSQPAAVPGFDAGLAREYEDYVLGRLYVDLAFERAADALVRYRGRDRDRALAFLLGQLGQRTAIGGAAISPAVLKRLLDEEPATAISEGWESIRSEGLLPALVEQYGRIIAGIRVTGDLLGGEDVFELERGTALAEFGQRLALRQALQAAGLMLARLPRHKPRLRPRSHSVATRLLDEDSYPVGGFASISSRGSIESLLHSQLIFMERDARPDLFDIKFVRDELLYYSRDENQFLRRRGTFVFVLWPDLIEARFKDAELPFQRIVMMLAVLTATVRKLIEWLSDEALRFEFLFLDKADHALEPEAELVRMLLADQLDNGTVVVDRLEAENLSRHCELAARRSLCQCLWVSSGGPGCKAKAEYRQGSDQPVVSTSHLVIAGPAPTLRIEQGPVEIDDADAPAEAWFGIQRGLLNAWVAGSQH